MLVVVYDPLPGPERDDRIEYHHDRRLVTESLHERVGEAGQHHVALPVELGQSA
jgi:hypothetical protein